MLWLPRAFRRAGARQILDHLAVVTVRRGRGYNKSACEQSSPRLHTVLVRTSKVKAQHKCHTLLKTNNTNSFFPPNIHWETSLLIVSVTVPCAFKKDAKSLKGGKVRAGREYLSINATGIKLNRKPQNVCSFRGTHLGFFSHPL